MTDELITEFSSLVDRIMAMHSATAGLDYLVRSELVWSLRKMRTDEESRWLHHTATELCRDPASVKRQIGCDLLSMSNDLSPEQQQEAVRVLISLLDDPDGRVLEAAIHALRNNDAARPEMLNRLELAHHHSFEVRLALAWAIGESHPPPPVVRTLVAMSMDENERVRDWATFELGSVCEVDTLEIREALHERLHDTDFDTRS